MTAKPGDILRMSYLAASVAGVAFFVLSVVWLGVWPARILGEQSRATGPEHVLALTPSEARGRAIYAREGCAYCHTQQIRYTGADITRFGAPTLAWETRADYPHLWGTRRIGPDLARVGGTRSEDWHLAHFYAPRSVVPASVMPSYRTLFDRAPGRPLQDARDLVAYLETLGRERELAGTEGEARVAASVQEHMGMPVAWPILNAHPARTRRRGDVPPLPADGDAVAGKALYAQHCAACHGVTGLGDGPGATGLRPRPANLAEHEYSLTRLAGALWNGVSGTSMPAWRDRSIDELSAIAAHVQSLSADFAGRGDQAPSEERADASIGAGVYAANCAQCHGPDGAGDGSAAGELGIAPTDFQRQRPSLAWAVQALRNGIDGTLMAPWTPRLSDDDLIAVAHHVRGLFAGDGQAGGAIR